MFDLVVGDPIDAALVRARAQKRLFGVDEIVTIGRLVLQHRLGSGAAGVVYQALDPDLGRTVAVKLLQVQDDEARLLREARALAQLRHDNVVAVYDVGTWQGRVFVTMEHVAGGTLRTWLAAERRDRRQTVGVLARAGRGVAAAHRAGLIHRDIKPDNVLVGDDGEVRVADFGLAHDGEEVAPPHDGAGFRPVGTPAYLAPEVIAGGRADAASDQYGFCVMAFEALHGVRPTTSSLARTDHGVPVHLRRALARGLSIEPAGRHATMDDLVAALERDPTRGRGLALLVVGAALGAGAVVWAVSGGSGGRGGVCAASGTLDDVWGDARRVQVDRALRASADPSAPAIATSAATALDGYAQAWSRASRAACEDTHVRRVQSQALLDLRTRCLTRRRAALAAAIDLLAAGGPDGVATALPLVEALPPIADCDDTEALSAPVAPPADPATAAQLTALQVRLGAQEVMANTARLDEALGQGQALVADARTLGYRPFVAEALLALATIRRTRGDKAEAAALLRDTLAEAQASRHDAIVAVAAIKLASHHADGELDRAEELMRLAAATIERLGASRVLQADYESAYGKLMFRAGRYADAVAHLERAAALDVEAERTGTLAHAQLLNNLGGGLVAVGREVDAVAQLERSLALRERLLGDGHPDVAETLNTLGAVEIRLGRGDAALAHLDRAHGIVERRDGPQELWSMILDNRAGALLQAGRTEPALADMRRSVAIVEQLLPAGDTRLAEAYLNLGATLQEVPELRDDAIVQLDRALAIYAAAGQGEHPNVAIALFTRGIVRHAQQRFGEAVADCERAAAIGTRALGADHPFLQQVARCRSEANEALKSRARDPRRPPPL